MIRISIIEDHRDFRNGLMQLLQIAEGFTPLNSYSNAEDAIAYLSDDEDIILLDINLPKMSGVDAIPYFKQKFPNLKIVMLTMFDDDNTIIEAIINGANGYLLKKTPPEVILTSLQTCMLGGSPMSAGIASKVLTLFRKYIPQKKDNYDLTKREMEILNLLVEGIENQQIADDLFISIQTVRNHIRHIYEKLQVHSKSQAVVKALRERLI